MVATEQGERRPDAPGGTRLVFCLRCKAKLCTVAPDGWVGIKHERRYYHFRPRGPLHITCQCGARWGVTVDRRSVTPVD